MAKAKSYEAYRALLNEPNVQRALATIRAAEGTARRADPYRVGFGFRSIGHLDDHPREYNSYGKTVTSAAGAYQALERTWDDVDRRIGLPNFGPEAQDVFAVAKIDDRRALDAVRKGDFDTFAKRVSNEWASFPGNSYGQPTKTRQELRAAWDAAKVTQPANRKADQRLANAWGYQDPNTTRGLTTPLNTPTPNLRQPTLDGVQVARGIPAPTQAFRGITLSSAPPNTFATAYAPEPTRVGAVAAMPVASQQYDLPATPTARSTVQGRAGIPTPMQAPRDAMPATRSARVGPGLPDQRVAQAFQDATKFVDLNQRSASQFYDPNATQPVTRIATPTPAPRLAAPIQAGFGPVAQQPFTPERLAGFPTPTQRGTPVARPAVGSFAPAMPEPVAAPTFASVARPSVPVPSRAPRMQGPTLPAAPVAAPVPSVAPRTAAAAIETAAPRQAAPVAAAVTPYSTSRTAAPATSAPAAPAAPAEVTPYSATQGRVGGLGGLGGYVPGLVGGAIGGALLGPVGAALGAYVGNRMAGSSTPRAAGNGVTTGLITGRAIPASVLSNPARYGQGGFTGHGLPSAPRTPSQSQALKDRDRRGGRGDSGPAMSKSASDAIGKSGAGRGGLY